MNETLGNALTSVETSTEATPSPAQTEQPPVTDQSTESTDSSLQTSESVELKPDTDTTEQTPEQIATAKREHDFGELRSHRDTLVSENAALRQQFDTFGGESQLKIMAPLLEKAREIPRSPQEIESWSEGMWGSMRQSMLPTQVEGLRAEAAWSYINDPVGVRQITQALYGAEGQQLPADLPDVIREFVTAYLADPTVVDILRPDETPDQKLQRQQYEARERERDERDRTRDEQFQKIETENHKRISEQTMSQVLQVGLGGRAEVKKQFGLEFHENGDTPEMAAFNRRLSDRYDRIVTQALMSDAQLSQLCNSAEYLAGQKDESQRKRAMDQYGPEIKQRVTAVCTQIAKDLAEDRKFLDPASSDRAKAANLKDLPAQVLGGNGGQSQGVSGIGKLPDPIADPVGFQRAVAKLAQERQTAQRTPGILQAG